MRGIWVFVADGASLPSAVFDEEGLDREWIGQHALSGVLTQYPLNVSVYDWAIENGATVMNLSLSSKSEALYPVFHELADNAYFANSVLVCAANNVPGNSYPSLFASVVSVASHDLPAGDAWFYNPSPPVEFAGRGLEVPVAWKDGGTLVATGNSFAAPHIAGWVARLRSTFPAATPFEVKAILAALATPIPG